MKNFVEQFNDLDQHIKQLGESFQKVKSQLEILPDQIQKENTIKFKRQNTPKTPQTEVSENDIDNYTLKIEDYIDLEIDQEKQKEIQMIKNFNDLFKSLNNFNIDKDYLIIQKLLNDNTIQTNSTKPQKNILKFVNKIIAKIRLQVEKQKEISKQKSLQPKTINIKKQKSLRNLNKQKKTTFDDIRKFYEEQNFEQLDKYLKKDDWKLLNTIVNFDIEYNDMKLPELSIVNHYENLKQFCFNSRKDNFESNILEHCKNGELEQVYYDIQRKANINKKDYYGQTALILACRKGYYRIVDLLAENGADINQKSNLGQSGFMQACRYGHAKVVQVLLKHKVDTSTQDKYGKTGFIYACIKGYIEIVKQLIENRVDCNQKDNYTKKGLDYLNEENMKILIDFAKEKKIQLDLSKQKKG